MNAFPTNSQNGYAAAATTMRSTRDAEYDAFSRVTSMLHQADPQGRNAESIAAVSRNNELWLILSADLMNPDNALPDELKAGLLSLAGFSIRHGHAVMAGEATTDALIDVNISVMKGLRSNEAQT